MSLNMMREGAQWLRLPAEIIKSDGLSFTLAPVRRRAAPELVGSVPFPPLSSHSFPARATSSLVADSLICRRASTRLGEEGAGAAGWAELDTSTLARQALIRLQFCMTRRGLLLGNPPPTHGGWRAGGRSTSGGAGDR